MLFSMLMSCNDCNANDLDEEYSAYVTYELECLQVSVLGQMCKLFLFDDQCRWLSAALFTGSLGGLCYFGR